jgi:hypothetical protein
MMAEDCQSICKQVFTALRKTASVFFEIILSAGGVIAASTLMAYGLGLVRYMAGACGFSTLAFWIIVGVGIVWMILTKIMTLLWPSLFVDKLGLWLLSSIWMSFTRGFLFSILYIFLWILNERLPDYGNILERFFWVNVFVVLPVLCFAVICFLEKKMNKNVSNFFNSPLSFVVLVLIGLSMWYSNLPNWPISWTRAYVLRITPLGSSFEEVEETISKRGWHSSTSKEFGFRDQRTRPVRTVGSMHIDATLGKCRGFIFSGLVTAHWGFNDKEELIDVWVLKSWDML